MMQVCLFNYDDPCITFPTLPFDVAVDSFFLVIIIIIIIIIIIAA